MTQIRPTKHVLVRKDRFYNSFPSIVSRPDGSLVLGFRQAPDWQKVYGKVTHLDPASTAVMLRSTDGEHWEGEPEILYDDYLNGVQDPCLNTLRDGTIFATFFTWMVREAEEVAGRSGFSAGFNKWRGKLEGLYSIRSHDGGNTWDAPIRLPMTAAIRGNCVEMPDGAIIAPVYGGGDPDGSNVHIVRTEDRGQTWTFLAKLGDEQFHFHEPTLFRTKSGKLVMFTRTLKKNTGWSEKLELSPLFTSESTDGGITWSKPIRRHISSYNPFHVLQLKNGGVLVSYGYRFKPYGIRAILLDDECTNIAESPEITIRDDAAGPDIGYPSAVQLADGRVLITYYYCEDVKGPRFIAGTFCELE